MQRERRPYPERFPESLEARLRALPQPPVPADLEAQLLAAIPVEMVNPRRRWAVLVGALAAACVMAVLLWSRRPNEDPDRSPEGGPSANQGTPRPPQESAHIAASLSARRDLDEAKMPPFTWPLSRRPPIRLSASISPDLLD